MYTERVEYVHRKGYLHNDIKSSNVLQICNESQYQPVLIDFGKSRPIKEEGQKRVRADSSSYLPEVVKGIRAETVASDVFSLGKMMASAVSCLCFIRTYVMI